MDRGILPTNAKATLVPFNLLLAFIMAMDESMDGNGDSSDSRIVTM